MENIKESKRRGRKGKKIGRVKGQRRKEKSGEEVEDI
jgi:hypothetical protein